MHPFVHLSVVFWFYSVLQSRSIPVITLTDYMCAGKKGEEERPALMIVLKHRYHDSKSTLKGTEKD